MVVDVHSTGGPITMAPPANLQAEEDLSSTESVGLEAKLLGEGGDLVRLGCWGIDSQAAGGQVGSTHALPNSVLLVPLYPI